MSGTDTFWAGKYTYVACVQDTVGGWSSVGPAKSFTVDGMTSAPDPNAAADATVDSDATGASDSTAPSVRRSSGSTASTAGNGSDAPDTSSQSSPESTTPANSSTLPTGDLAGWDQVFAEDFDTPVALGSFSGSKYADELFAYDGYRDTSGAGMYSPRKVLSAGNGVLDWYLHTEDGQPYVSSIVPKIPSTGWGQEYGRYSVRYRSDEMTGYKIAFMLWPDSDNWGEGEIDFPETGNLDSADHIYANLFKRGNTATGTPGSSGGFTTQTAPAGNGWHTATTEWSPNKLTFILDGKTLGTLTVGVPTTSMHMVLQVETSLTERPASNVSGHLQVDWISMYSYTG